MISHGMLKGSSQVTCSTDFEVMLALRSGRSKLQDTQMTRVYVSGSAPACLHDACGQHRPMQKTRHFTHRQHLAIKSSNQAMQVPAAVCAQPSELQAAPAQQQLAVHATHQLPVRASQMPYAAASFRLRGSGNCTLTI